MSKKTLVIGASLKPQRYSNKAVRALSKHHHEVIAIGLRPGEIGEVTIHTDLKPYTDINTVTLYINPARQPDYYDYIIGLQPERVIFNPGTENPEFYYLLNKNSIQSEIACTLVLLSTDQY